ncbi:MAG: hypothetical protein ABSG57_11835 [Candidatus Bathyarchaeia archaeon]
MKWNLPEWNEEERERVRKFLVIANELKDEKGEIDEEGLRRPLETLRNKGEAVNNEEMEMPDL